MKMYLRHLSEKIYYTGKKEHALWSTSKQDAKAFLDFPAIDEVCAKENLKNMVIVADHGTDEVIIPVKTKKK